MKIEVGKQGTLDGLCGIYCLANAIRTWEPLQHRKEGAGREAFRLIIEATDRSGLLTSSKVCGGYEWYELVEIFNFFASMVKYQARAMSLAEALSVAAGNSRISKVRDLIRNGYQLVLPVDNDEHWILANKVKSNGVVSFDDPWPGEKAREVDSISDTWGGVAIEPSKGHQ